jgi:hypothetical protein
MEEIPKYLNIYIYILLKLTAESERPAAATTSHIASLSWSKEGGHQKRLRRLMKA